MRLAAALALALSFLPAGRGAAAPDSALKEREALVERVIGGWPSPSRKAARAVMDKYGPPHMITHKCLVWIGNGQWKGTLVYRAGALASPPGVERRALRQFVSYRVPPDKLAALARFGGGVSVDPIRGELAAESDSEEENFLALNMADEVVSGRRQPEEARALYARTLSLALSGKSSPAMSRLQFDTGRSP